MLLSCLSFDFGICQVKVVVWDVWPLRYTNGDAAFQSPNEKISLMHMRVRGVGANLFLFVLKSMFLTFRRTHSITVATENVITFRCYGAAAATPLYRMVATWRRRL